MMIAEHGVRTRNDGLYPPRQIVGSTILRSLHDRVASAKYATRQSQGIAPSRSRRGMGSGMADRSRFERKVSSVWWACAQKGFHLRMTLSIRSGVAAGVR